MRREKYNYSTAEHCLRGLIAIRWDDFESGVKLCLLPVCTCCCLLPDGVEHRFCNKWEERLKMKGSSEPTATEGWDRLQLLSSSAPFRRSCWSQWIIWGRATCVQTDPTENSKPSNCSVAITHSGSHVRSYFIQTELSEISFGCRARVFGYRGKEQTLKNEVNLIIFVEFICYLIICLREEG